MAWRVLLCITLVPLASAVRTSSDRRVAISEQQQVASGPPDAKAWLAKGLAYIHHPQLRSDAKAYLDGTSPAVKTWKGGVDWEEWLIKAMEKLNQTGVEVDDHQGTPIGEGASIGVVAAKVIMDRDQLALLPEDFQSGLLRACEGACATWPAVVRVSHTKAVGLDLMRIALAIGHPDLGTVNLLFTETIKSFPIGTRDQLAAFAYQVENGAGATLLRYPLSVASLAWNARRASMTYGPLVQQAGALGKDYYSLTPFLIGGGDARVAGAMKWRLVPTTGRTPFPAVEAGGDAKVALRKQLVDRVTKQAHSFSLEIQVATDPDKHPVNDAAKEWDETAAPWVPMGTVTIPAQTFPADVDVGNVVGSGLWQNGVATFNSKELVFAPGETPHRPIGDINTFRADLYPVYDRRRQEHLLGKKGGVAAQCPFANIAQWLR